jgi:hypothetical protein
MFTTAMVLVLLPYPQEDADDPAELPSSKVQQLMHATKAWLLGEGCPRVDVEDIHEARGVTAFAKETLMPALYEVRVHLARLVNSWIMQIKTLSVECLISKLYMQLPLYACNCCQLCRASACRI